MNIEQILEGAPEGATHVETVDYSDKPETFEYLKYDGACWYEFVRGEWVEDASGRLSCYADIRNLSDLRTIIAQDEEIERLKRDMARLKVVSDEAASLALDHSQFDHGDLQGLLISQGVFSLTKFDSSIHYDSDYSTDEGDDWIVLTDWYKSLGETK